ncbi:alpha/beta hydrolase domain-containing protein [Muricoccus vinaceus]|uniref:Alpha/beta hydrolase domain-containing protein n=1 Tax=Muricoccus vinaceus TaxID=424704 RepID=A0ABV6IS33_9PROT
MRQTAVLAGMLALATPATAQVTRFEVTEDVPAFAGRSFGEAGAYRRVTGRATIALDPADPRNAVITDLAEAPRNAEGRVEATADVVILRPEDPARGSGTLLLDVPNRGRKLAPQLFDDARQPGANTMRTAEDAGIGFLAGRGTTVVWVGWQADIPSQPGQLALSAPVLRGVTGPVREEFVFDHRRSPAPATLAWPLADPPNLSVTVRQAWPDPRQSPPGLSARALDAQRIEVSRPEAGFDAGALYEVTYTARDPAVLGMGFAAVRDIVAFLRRDTSAANPLAFNGRPAVHRAIGFGVSQSGRFLRDFLHLGFNEDTAGRVVFDGLMPHVAGARRMATNLRFGQPGRNARHPQDPAWQADTFPFTYAVLDDPLSGRRDGLMLRCRLTSTCPRVMQSDSEHEWWASRASLLVTDTAGHHIDLPPDVRAYMIAGTPHFAEPGETAGRIEAMALPKNPMHAGPPMRALLAAMEAWLAEGREPPASRVPMRAHGTLVPAAQAMPAPIPGLPYAAIHTAAALSDQSAMPPREIGRYPVFVPRLDGDGMAVAGLRALQLAAPRASYTGWNPRAQGFGPAALYPLQGAVVPFAATREARLSAGDPRPSVAERYADGTAYVAAVRRAAEDAVAERLLLPRDAEALVERAKAGSLAQLR